MATASSAVGAESASFLQRAVGSTTVQDHFTYRRRWS